ncbi:MAG: RT0821/Lpp0805 family surface protein [Rhodospirillaceae bacterium]
MKFRPLITVLALTTALTSTACTSPQYGGDGTNNALGMGTKQTFGGILGAAGGGLLGAQVGKPGSALNLAMVGLGVVGGGLLGSSVGKSLDEIDRQKAAEAAKKAEVAPVGQTIAWNNPNTGHHGTVTAVRDGRNNATGQYCREFRTKVTVGDKSEQGVGTACRNSDGSWTL